MVSFIHGLDRALLNQEVNNVLKDFSEEEKANLTLYDADSFDMEQMIADCNTISMFEDRKIVLVRDPLFLYKSPRGNEKAEAERKMLEEYLDHPSPFTELIFLWDEQNNPSSGSNPFQKLLEKKAKNIKTKPMDELGFQGLVKKDLEKNHIDITKEAVQVLLERLSPDISAWHKELEKLVLFDQKIGPEEVELLVPRQVEEDAFALTNALMDRNLKKTLKAYSDQLYLKHSPMEMVSTIATSLRRYYYCLYLRSQNYSNAQISDLCSLSEKQVAYLCSSGKRFSYERALYLLNKLAEVDQDYKTGKRDIQLALELFFIEATR